MRGGGYSFTLGRIAPSAYSGGNMCYASLGTGLCSGSDLTNNCSKCGEISTTICSGASSHPLPCYPQKKKNGSSAATLSQRPISSHLAEKKQNVHRFIDSQQINNSPLFNVHYQNPTFGYGSGIDVSPVTSSTPSPQAIVVETNGLRQLSGCAFFSSKGVSAVQEKIPLVQEFSVKTEKAATRRVGNRRLDGGGPQKSISLDAQVIAYV